MAWVVRESRAGDEQGICAVCRAGFAASSEGLLGPDLVASRSEEFYDPERVRRELSPAPPHWLGYVVADLRGEVVGASGGSVEGTVGHVLVLYLDLDRRGEGIGSALLQRVTEQQRALGADRQRVSVTEGNEMGLPFYRARGFTAVGRTPFDGSLPDGPQSLVLERGV